MAYVEQWLAAQLADANAAPAFPMLSPQGQAMPVVIYSRTGTSRERMLLGTASVPVATFDVSIFAATYSAAKAIGEDIRNQIDDYAGAATGMTIERCTLTDESDSIEVPTDGNSKPTYIVALVFDVRFQET